MTEKTNERQREFSKIELMSCITEINESVKASILGERHIYYSDPFLVRNSNLNSFDI